MSNRVWRVQPDGPHSSELGHLGREPRGGAGFTLIEVVVVLGIIALLSAVAIFALGNTAANSAASACKVDAKSLQSALEEFRTDNNGAYPAGPQTTADSPWQLLTTHQSGFVGSPFLTNSIPTNHYLLWWSVDPLTNQLHIWVDHGVQPSLLPATYNQATAQDILVQGNACSTYAK